MHDRAELETSRKKSCSSWVARTVITALGMLVGFTLFSSPANAQTVLPDTDPHGLIAYFNRVSAYSISKEHPDRLEVWACNTLSGEPASKSALRVDPVRLVRQFKAAAQRYFAWLSENRYRPEFIVGGTVTAENDTKCRDTVYRSRPGSNKITGIIIMTDTESVTFPRDGTPIPGYASFGELCSYANIQADSCPGKGRYTVLRSNRSDSEFHDHLLVHEMGHMLSFPHSFNDKKPGGEYNNRMDVMSAGITVGVNIGTLAVNRYLSGWMTTKQVKVIPAPEGNSQLDGPYYLEYIGEPGLQMMVLPVKKGEFYTLGTRVRLDRDSEIPLEGVEVYRIDQFGCDKSSYYYKTYAVCVAVNLRTEPFVADGRSGGDFGHVYRVGEVIELEEDIAWNNTQIWIRVLKPTEAGYMVWVGSGPVRSGPFWQGKFLDDEGSVHESSINQLAASGITLGCDSGRYGRGPHQFCPEEKVTRAQMVRFLGRALGLTVKTDGETPSLDFTDINLEAEYAQYLNALGPIATGYPDGTFRPSQPITRGEVAIMLNRALPLNDSGDRNAYADVDESDEPELAKAVANLAAAGITQGCASEPEPLFCPDKPLSRAQMASLLVRSPLDTSSDDDDEEGRPVGRSVRIEVGDPSTRCPQGVTCWGLHRDYDYKFSDGFGSPPYTLECWIGGQLAWAGDWRGEPTRGCYSWGSGQTVHVVVDGVESNKLLWAQPDDEETQPEETQSDGREVRISVGDPSTRCPQGVTCWGLHRDYHYEFSDDFGSPPYTLECWIDGSRRWAGIWSGRSTTGCYMWGDGGEIVYVVVDGVKSNELRWAQPDDDEVWPDGGETPQPDGRKVRIEWGKDLSSDSDPYISSWCEDYVYCREFDYELDGFGSGPYTLECWLNGTRRGSRVWQGPEYPERGCRVKGNILLVPYVIVDGVKSNELRWPDDEETQSDDEETQSDGPKVRIKWGKDLSSDDPWCSGYVYCQDFSYELTDFGSGPYKLECWLNDRWWGSKIWSGPEERGCRVKGNKLLIPYVIVDGVESNKLLWSRSDDEETQPDDQEGVQTEWHVNDKPSLSYRDEGDGSRKIQSLDSTVWGKGPAWWYLRSEGYSQSDSYYTFAFGDAPVVDNRAEWLMGSRIGIQEIQVYIPGNSSKPFVATVDYEIRIAGEPRWVRIEQERNKGWVSLGRFDLNGAEVTIRVDDTNAYPRHTPENEHKSRIGINAVRMRCVSNCTP